MSVVVCCDNSLTDFVIADHLEVAEKTDFEYGVISEREIFFFMWD